MEANGVQQQDVSAASALAHVFEAGQRVVIDRIDLARLEARAIAGHSIRGALLWGAGAFFAAVGWCVLNAVAILLLAARLEMVVSLTIVGAVNGGLGAGFAAAGGRHTRRLLAQHPEPGDR
jgi:ammonia channel protein AmtB